MRQSHPSAARARLSSPWVKADPSDPLFAAHAVLERLVHVRFAMMDAENQASDGHLGDLAPLLREHITGLDQLLRVVIVTVKTLEAAGKAVQP